MQPPRPPRWSSMLYASLACLGIQGCGSPLRSYVNPVPVDAVDARGISLDRARELGRGAPAESVALVLGEPADRPRGCVPGEIIWRYPIRAWNDMAGRRQIVPAVLLRIEFDGSDRLTDWNFVDSRTGTFLPVAETPGEASRWFASLSEAPPPVPPRIDLDEVLIRGRTTRADVTRILGQWQPDLYCGSGGPVPVVRQLATASGTVLDWYADRPSPLFVPPRYLVASFDDSGNLIVWHFEQTYPGGTK